MKQFVIDRITRYIRNSLEDNNHKVIKVPFVKDVSENLDDDDVVSPYHVKYRREIDNIFDDIVQNDRFYKVNVLSLISAALIVIINLFIIVNLLVRLKNESILFIIIIVNVFISIGSLFVIYELLLKRWSNKQKVLCQFIKILSNQKIYDTNSSNVYLLSDVLDIEKSSSTLFVYTIPDGYTFDRNKSPLSSKELDAIDVLLQNYELTDDTIYDYVTNKQVMFDALEQKQLAEYESDVNNELNNLKEHVYKSREKTPFVSQLNKTKKQLQKEMDDKNEG